MDWTAIHEWLTQERFGNSMQNYVVGAVVFLFVYCGLPVLKHFVIKYLEVLSKKTKSDFDDMLEELLNKVIGPFVYLATALYLGTLSLTLPESIAKLLQAVFVIVLAFKVVQIFEHLVIYGLQRWTRKRLEEDPTSRSMVKNMTLVLRIALWGGAVLFILDNLGINVTAFIAGLGVGGVAVALAAQSILGDTFSSFAIFMDRPFEVGDFIIVGDMLGTVEHVGFKTTRIRSLFGEQLIFPNSDLTGSRIKNYKRMKERRIAFGVGVIYQTTVAKVKQIPEIVKTIIDANESARFDRAHFQKFGDFSLDYEIVYYVLSPDYNIYMDVQQSINFKIMEAFEKEQIEFAYPTQQLFVTKSACPLPKLGPAS